MQIKDILIIFSKYYTINILLKCNLVINKINFHITLLKFKNNHFSFVNSLRSCQNPGLFLFFNINTK